MAPGQSVAGNPPWGWNGTLNRCSRTWARRKSCQKNHFLATAKNIPSARLSDTTQASTETLEIGGEIERTSKSRPELLRKSGLKAPEGRLARAGCGGRSAARGVDRLTAGVSGSEGRQEEPLPRRSICDPTNRVSPILCSGRLPFRKSSGCGPAVPASERLTTIPWPRWKSTGACHAEKCRRWRPAPARRASSPSRCRRPAGA